MKNRATRRCEQSRGFEFHTEQLCLSPHTRRVVLTVVEFFCLSLAYKLIDVHVATSQNACLDVIILLITEDVAQTEKVSYPYPIFFVAPPYILNGEHIQEIVKGQTSFLECKVDRGKPEALIHWLIYQNNTSVFNFPEITNNTDPRYKILENGLQITNVQPSDERIYRCYVYNEHGTVYFDIQAAFAGKL